MQASIISFGHDVFPFTGITATAFTDAFVGNPAFVMPEQEVAELNPDLDDAARAVIRDFVQNGGRMIIGSDGTNDTSFTPSLLNAVFGFAVTNNTTVSDPTNRVLTGTIFDVAPASLPANNATEGLDLTSLPPGTLSVYADATVAVVAIIPFGKGDIIFLGYDWFDSNPPDDVEGQDGGWQDVFAAALAEADLSVTKTVSDANVEVDDEVTFTVTATNNGPSDAINAVVTDILPVGLTFVSATTTQGTCSGDTEVTCELGGLANGASATITIVVTADVEGNLVNQAEIAGAMIDPDMDNNSASATVTVKNIPTNISGAGCAFAPQATAPQGLSLFGLLSAAGVVLVLRRRAQG
ncbi:MAG: DUF11 domain-containing protein [Deltaproteobacteria bacterium]|nr:DUF11 domain-containing protein [Deltaproteobacteria bacterium]